MIPRVVITEELNNKITEALIKTKDHPSIIAQHYHVKCSQVVTIGKRLLGEEMFRLRTASAEKYIIQKSKSIITKEPYITAFDLARRIDIPYSTLYTIFHRHMTTMADVRA